VIAVALALALSCSLQDAGARAAPDARVATLARDPRTLPKSDTGRWKHFDPARLAPGEMPPEMSRARDAILDGDMPSALVALYRVLDAQPDFPPALHQMGVLYFRLQRYGDSIVPLERYVALLPERVGETRVLGHDYYSLGRYREARAHYERVVARVPGDVEALRGLALSTWRLGDADKALELLARVVEIAPGHGEAWAWRAQILFDRGDAQEALDAAQRARQLDPFEPRAWFLLGRALLELGREEEGEQAQRRFEELSAATQEIRRLQNRLLYAPHELSLLRSLADVHARTGNVALARETLGRLVRERPDDVELRIFALDVHERLGDVDGAKLAAEMLETKGASDARAWKRLEIHYASIGDLTNAARANRRCRELEAR
jgi:tetratricopeptide (TPR) repeat protein